MKRSKTKTTTNSKSNTKSYSSGYFVVEKVLDKKFENGKAFYLIKWKDYPDSDNSWLPEENVATCRKLIEEFEKKISNISAKDYTKENLINKKRYRQEDEDDFFIESSERLEQTAINGNKKIIQNVNKFVSQESDKSFNKANFSKNYTESNNQKDTEESKEEINSIFSGKSQEKSFYMAKIYKNDENNIFDESRVFLHEKNELVYSDEELDILKGKGAKGCMCIKHLRQDISCSEESSQESSDDKATQKEIIGDINLHQPLRIKSSKLNSNDQLICLIEWKQTSKNERIIPSKYTNYEIREKFKEMLLDYYESLLIFHDH